MGRQKIIIELQKLPEVECWDNGEDLVEVPADQDRIRCESMNFDLFSAPGQRMHLRSGALERLLCAGEALKSLDSRLSLRLASAYLHPASQRKDLRLRTLPAAGHPTGGAIDVTLVKDEVELDMGSGIGESSSNRLLPRFTEDLTREQIDNRHLLRELLVKQGFAPRNDEWWHFSYGDRDWAAYYGYEEAVYESISFILV